MPFATDHNCHHSTHARQAEREEHDIMKITAIKAHYVRIPFDMGAPPTEFAGLRWPTMDHLLIEVETDAGITGWGEGFGHTIIPATAKALECYVAPWFIGKDPTDINALHRDAAQAFHIFGRNGPVVYAHLGSISRYGISQANGLACRLATFSAARGASRFAPIQA
ncbi:MAG: hypothetical protein R3D67_10230 [Hyphomicrobiaceae bacterium]